MQKPVVVFSPTLFVSVAIEQQPDGAEEVHFHPAGQGFWVARMVRTLEAPAVLCTAVGGESGSILRPLLATAGITLHAIPARLPNRVQIHDRRSGSSQTIATTPSGPWTRHEIDDLHNLFVSHAMRAGAAVLTGPLPEAEFEPKLYGRVARELGQNGVPVLADLSGECLHALGAGTRLLKIEHDELIDAGLACDASPQELARGMRALRARGIQDIVCSRAAEPALALLQDRLLELRAPQLEVVNEHGAGDSMMGALAVGLARGQPETQLMQLAVAAGCLNVTRRGLGSGRRESIERLAGLIDIHARPDL